MSDFDKKKSSVNNNENYNKKVDHTDDDIYEIPDIVSNGKKSNKMEDRKDKKKKTDHTQKHMFENRLHHHRKEKEKSDILEELEFISEESVKDKSRMAEGKPISHEFVSKKKTLRRSVDARGGEKGEICCLYASEYCFRRHWMSCCGSRCQCSCHRC